LVLYQSRTRGRGNRCLQDGALADAVDAAGRYGRSSDWWRTRRWVCDKGELSKIKLDLVAISGGLASCEIGRCDLVSAYAVIENAKLELEPWRIRRIDQHTLERRNRALVVAGLEESFCLSEGEVEFARPALAFA
jgi:hypothetical protein